MKIRKCRIWTSRILDLHLLYLNCAQDEYVEFIRQTHCVPLNKFLNLNSYLLDRQRLVLLPRPWKWISPKWNHIRLLRVVQVWELKIYGYLNRTISIPTSWLTSKVNIRLVNTLLFLFAYASCLMILHFSS